MNEIVHVVCWRVQGRSDAERLQNRRAIVAAVEATRGRIPGLLSLDVGDNLIPGSDAWDVGAVMVFRSRADLDAYQDHPAHLAVKAAVGPLRTARGQLDIVRHPSQNRPRGEARSSMDMAGSQALIDEVMERFSETPDPRLKDILASLIHHLHGFIRETQLSEQEWMRGIEFLTAVGRKCDDRRQEFILLSDVLGASMQVVAAQRARAAGCTESTVFGPFHVEGAPKVENGGDVANGAKGTPCTVRCTVRSADGQAIPDAQVDVWQSDDDGFYDVQRPELTTAQGRGALASDGEGRFWFRSVVPVPYPVPTDGPVGVLLRAANRSAWRPAHLHFRIRAEGYETLITHVFRRGAPNLASDPVFGVRSSLVADWPKNAKGEHDLCFDFVLQRATA